MAVIRIKHLLYSALSFLDEPGIRSGVKKLSGDDNFLALWLLSEEKFLQSEFIVLTFLMLGFNFLVGVTKSSLSKAV